MKILITDYKATLDRDLEREISLIKAALPDAHVEILEYNGDKERLKAAVRDAVAIKTAFVMLDSEILAAAPCLKIVSFNSTGCNNIDMSYAKAHKITVTNVPDYCTDEVADHTLLLIMELNKRIPVYVNRINAEKNWSFRLDNPPRSLKGQTLAVIGFGKIGRAVAQRAAAFGMNVTVCSRHLSDEEALRLSVTKSDLEEIRKSADIISLHTNLDESTRGSFGEEFFAGLEKKPLFINVSRGGLVDENALVKALDRGQISGAGLDVLSSESPTLDGNPLMGRDNVIITPHIAFYSQQAMERLHKQSTENIVYYLSGRFDIIKAIPHN